MIEHLPNQATVQKARDAKDYFVGAHDANRVLFITGRDIHHSAEQKGGPLHSSV
jgi:hypothetical protein